MTDVGPDRISGWTGPHVPHAEWFLPASLTAHIQPGRVWETLGGVEVAEIFIGVTHMRLW